LAYGLVFHRSQPVLEATLSDGDRKKQFRGYCCIDGQLARREEPSAPSNNVTSLLKAQSTCSSAFT
jgi:hypothetical protein